MKRFILLLLVVALLLSSQQTVYAEEPEQSKTQENEEETRISTVIIEPLNSSIIMRKDLKTATLPVYLSHGLTITTIRTSQSNFKAEYENGVIQITAFNTADYAEHSDVQVSLYLEGFDSTLLPFTEEIQVMIEMETKKSISEELNKITPIDVTQMTAYNRTLYLNALDKRKIAANVEDFSDIKIACIGDSITEGVGLAEDETALYSYPADLKHILNAQEVINMGKGGTSISYYWDSFLSITEKIPEDTDIILVLGGVNDCYSGNRNNMGNQTDLERGTFYGDTNFLMQDLKERYPDSSILFITPLPTVTSTSYLTFLPDMLSLSLYAAVIREMGEKNEIPVFDLYSEGFLDSDDEDVMNNFMYDGVHPNAKGYYILAEHIAGKLIDMEKENED